MNGTVRVKLSPECNENLKTCVNYFDLQRSLVSTPVPYMGHMEQYGGNEMSQHNESANAKTAPTAPLFASSLMALFLVIRYGLAGREHRTADTRH